MHAIRDDPENHPSLRGARHACAQEGSRAAANLRPSHDVDDIVHGLSISSLLVLFFSLGWPPGTRRDLGCYIYHFEKTPTHLTPPGVTELYPDTFGTTYRTGDHEHDSRCCQNTHVNCRKQLHN